MYESDGEYYMRNWMGYRMDAYWMPAHEIQDLFLLHSTTQSSARWTTTPGSSFRWLSIIRFARCRERKNRLTRAIRSESLIPLYLCVMHSGRWSPTSDVVDPGLASFFKELGMIRVEDVVEGLSIMEVCAVCLRSPTVGARISQLPSCGHVFHSHCIVPWLIKSNSCPMCRS